MDMGDASEKYAVFDRFMLRGAFASVSLFMLTESFVAVSKFTFYPLTWACLTLTLVVSITLYMIAYRRVMRSQNGARLTFDAATTATVLTALVTSIIFDRTQALQTTLCCLAMTYSVASAFIARHPPTAA